MDWKSLSNNILSNLVWWLLVLGGGAMLALLKIYWPRFADPTEHVLFGVACLVVIAFAFKGKGLLAPNPTAATPESIEEHVRIWLDHFRISNNKEVAPAGAYFAIRAALRSGNQIGILRPKDTENYLVLQTTIVLSPEHKAAMETMTPNQVERTMRDIIIEFLRVRINYALDGPPFRAMILSKGLRIAETLREDIFMAALDDMDNAANMAKFATTVAIDRNAPNSTLVKAAKQPERGRTK